LITKSLSAAMRFLGPAWKQGWGAMSAAGALFATLWARGLLSVDFPWRGASFLSLVAAVVIVQGGLYRVALGHARPGPGGLQWGGVEWRLSAVLSLTSVFLFVLALLGFVVILAFAFAVASAGHGFIVAQPSTWPRAVDGRGRAVVVMVGAAGLFGMIWAAARVSLGGAATVAKSRVQVLASWTTTRGLVTPIVVGWVILGGGAIGLACLALYVGSWATPPSPVAIWVAGLAAGGVLAGLWLPLNVGLMAYLYKQTPSP
jgi:hypothetical protein